jgi:RHS repeat-associated protein
MTYRLTDGLGSTVNLCDQDGELVGEYTYDAYGNVRAQSGAETEFSFAGEQSDPNGLDFLRARYYDPEIGRFLSGDPLGGGYGYAGGNPVNAVDPSGLWTVCLSWDSSLSNHESGQFVCAVPREVGSVYTSQVVYDDVTGEWVLPFEVTIWQLGDWARGGDTSVSKLRSDLWIVETRSSAGYDQTYCTAAWQEVLGSAQINYSWCGVDPTPDCFGEAWGLGDWICGPITIEAPSWSPSPFASECQGEIAQTANESHLPDPRNVYFQIADSVVDFLQLAVACSP